MNITRTLLTAGVAMPFLYFIMLFGLGFLYPGFSHMVQVPSDLGAVDAPYAFGPLFNLGLMSVGILAIAGAIGTFQAFRKHGVSMGLSLTTALLFCLFGISYLLFAYYPLPDEMHGIGFLPMLGGVIALLFGALGIRNLDREGQDWKVVMTGFTITFILAFFLFDFPDIALIGDETNFGLWIRILALIWFSIQGYFFWSVRKQI